MRKFAVLMAGACGVMLVGATATAASAAGGTWGPAREIPGLSALNVGGSAVASSISCASAANCLVGGTYTDAGGHTQAFVASEQAGSWHAAQEIPGTGALNTGDAAVNSVSCRPAGDCAAVGEYLSSAGVSQAFAATEDNGTWHAAAPLPGTVPLGSGPGSTAETVSCTAAGSCGAGGYLENDTSGGYLAFVSDSAHGAWGTAVPVTSGALMPQFVTSISCTSAANCVAGGAATDASGHTQAFAVEEKSGVWGAAREIAGALNAGGNATVTSASCSSAGNCGVGGSYLDGSGHTQGFVVTEKNGSWTAAREVAGGLNAGGDAIVNSISCPSAGNCAAVGSYTDGGGKQQAFVALDRRWVWGTAREVAAGLNTGGNAMLNSVSCPAAGDCAAGGDYASGTRHEAFLITARNGVWGAAQEVAGGLNTGGDAGVGSVSCPSIRHCAATGDYFHHASGEAFVVSGAISPAGG